MRIRSVTGAFVCAAGIVATGVLVPVAALAAPPPDLHLEMLVGFTACVAGSKPTDGSITVKLLRANGTTRDTQTDDGGDTDWFVCFDKLPVAGNKIRMKTADPAEPDGIVIRTARIPDLTAVANRVTNVIRGHAPAGAELSIEYRECHVSDCSDPLTVTDQSNSHGRYLQDLGGWVDIDGADSVKVKYQNTHGDVFVRPTLAPYLEIRARNKVSMLCQPKGTTTVKLRKADGTLRASKTFTAAGDCGIGNSSFKKNGHAVNLKPGNLISADFASDALLVWPAVSVNGVGTMLSGRCLENAAYEVRMDRDSLSSSYGGTTDANGDFSADVGPPAFDPGDTLEMTCESTRGDQVSLERTL